MNEYKPNGCNCISSKGCGRQDKQLNVFDWLVDVPGNMDETDYVEVQFKNTRKGYYLNSNKIPLQKDDIVAVEASPGHDIGTVTLTGSLVLLQMKKARIKSDAEVRRVYRKAREVDMEKYYEAKAKEQDTMIRSRQIAKDLGLEMKIGDVEYQGDGNKAIFYYIADGRVDFRQLIKVLADVFKVRIEMKQIGARQEAGRIGGIGPCGRELCCSTWLTSFTSVSTSAARFQDLSMNPQKLAGQCAKLKCCMNYEVDVYVEAIKRFPARDITLETLDNTYYHFKSDILKREITYSTDKSFAANLVTISTRRAFDIINLNKKGVKPESLFEDGNSQEPQRIDLLDQDSVTRFDSAKKKKKKKKPTGKVNGAPNPNREGKPHKENKRPDSHHGKAE
ncbi:MAG: hypothetical protein J6S11_00595 [Bacteroidaceae bacterium]|nr:hypothetical protein [Bacteroidaceae bacterium]